MRDSGHLGSVEDHVTQVGLFCPPDPDVLQEVQFGFWFLQLLDSVFVNRTNRVQIFRCGGYRLN